MKKSFAGVLFAIAALAQVGSSFAAADTTWKLFGLTKASDAAPVAWFYRADSIRRTPDGHLILWTERLPLPPIDRAIRKMGEPKAPGGYVPPFAILEGLDARGRNNAATMERLADSGDIGFEWRFLDEVDCVNARSRAIEMHEGTGATVRKPQQWQYPTTKGSPLDSLLRMVCKRYVNLDRFVEPGR